MNLSWSMAPRTIPGIGARYDASGRLRSGPARHLAAPPTQPLATGRVDHSRAARHLGDAIVNVVPWVSGWVAMSWLATSTRPPEPRDPAVPQRHPETAAGLPLGAALAPAPAQVEQHAMDLVGHPDPTSA